MCIGRRLGVGIFQERKSGGSVAGTRAAAWTRRIPRKSVRTALEDANGKITGRFHQKRKFHLCGIKYDKQTDVDKLKSKK